MAKSIGIINGWETKEITYEQVQNAVLVYRGYVRTLRSLGEEVPEHVEVTLKILSFIEPMYSDFKPKGG